MKNCIFRKKYHFSWKVSRNWIFHWNFHIFENQICPQKAKFSDENFNNIWKSNFEAKSTDFWDLKWHTIRAKFSFQKGPGKFAENFRKFRMKIFVWNFLPNAGSGDMWGCSIFLLLRPSDHSNTSVISVKPAGLISVKRVFVPQRMSLQWPGGGLSMPASASWIVHFTYSHPHVIRPGPYFFSSLILANWAL